MNADLLSPDFRTFKRRSEAVASDLTIEEMQRVKLALEYMVHALNKRIAAKSSSRRIAR